MSNITNVIKVLLAGLFLALIYGCSGQHMAKILLNEHNYSAAIPAYNLYLEKNSGDIEAISELGYAYYQTNQFDMAEKQFDKVLKAKPDHAFSVLYMGLIYVKQEKLKDAIKKWQGYANPEQPELEKEIKRQLTVLQIAESCRSAKHALAIEQRIGTQETDPNTVAVFYFRDISPDKQLKPFQKGLSAMIITGLSKIKGIKVVERLKLQSLCEEMKLGQAGIIDDSTAPRVGKLLGADKLVTGALNTGILASTSISSVSKQKVEDTVSVELPKEQFYEMPMKIIENIAKHFGIELSLDLLNEIKTSMPSNYEAFLNYSNAIDYIDRGEWDKASDQLDLAMKADPKFGKAKEEQQICPLPTDPSTSQISTMNTQDVAQYVSTSVNETITGGNVAEIEMMQPEPLIESEQIQRPQTDDIQQEQEQQKPVESIQDKIETINEEVNKPKKELSGYPGVPGN